MEFVQYVVQILPQISTEVTAHEFSCENDRDILIDFYRQTGGDDWRINFNWLSEKPLENWYGVKVNDKGRVVSLDLRTNRLDGSIPESIGRLSDLRTLNLMSNRLQGELPLEVLALIATIRTTPRSYVNLSHNTGFTLPENLGNLSPKIRSIDISNCSLTGSIPCTIIQLTNLVELNIEGNKFKGELEHICELEKLQKLDVDPYFWDYFNIPPDIASSSDLQTKLGYLRALLREFAEPLM